LSNGIGRDKSCPEGNENAWWKSGNGAVIRERIGFGYIGQNERLLHF